VSGNVKAPPLDPASPLRKDYWRGEEAPDFWRELARLAESEQGNMTITPKHARLLLYASGP